MLSLLLVWELTTPDGSSKLKGIWYLASPGVAILSRARIAKAKVGLNFEPHLWWSIAVQTFVDCTFVDCHLVLSCTLDVRGGEEVITLIPEFCILSILFNWITPHSCHTTQQ